MRHHGKETWRISPDEGREEIALFKALEADADENADAAEVIRDLISRNYFHVLVPLLYKLTDKKRFELRLFLLNTAAWNHYARDEAFLETLPPRSDFRRCCEELKKIKSRTEPISFLDLALQLCKRVIDTTELYTTTLTRVLQTTPLPPSLLYWLSRSNDHTLSEINKLTSEIIKTLIALQEERAHLTEKISEKLVLQGDSIGKEKCDAELKNLVAIQHSIEKMTSCLFQLISKKLLNERKIKNIYSIFQAFFLSTLKNSLEEWQKENEGKTCVFQAHFLQNAPCTGTGVSNIVSEGVEERPSPLSPSLSSTPPR